MDRINGLPPGSNSKGEVKVYDKPEDIPPLRVVTDSGEELSLDDFSADGHRLTEEQRIHKSLGIEPDDGEEDDDVE